MDKQKSISLLLLCQNVFACHGFPNQENGEKFVTQINQSVKLRTRTLRVEDVRTQQRCKRQTQISMISNDSVEVAWNTRPISAYCRIFVITGSVLCVRREKQDWQRRSQTTGHDPLSAHNLLFRPVWATNTAHRTIQWAPASCACFKVSLKV